MKYINKNRMNDLFKNLERLLYLTVFLVAGFSFVACEKTNDELVVESQQKMEVAAYTKNEYRHESGDINAGTHGSTLLSFECKNLYALTISNTGKYPVEIVFQGFPPDGTDIGSIFIQPKSFYSGHRKGNGTLKFWVRSTGDYASSIYYSFRTER